MKETLSFIYSDNLIKISFFASISLIIFQTILILVSYQKLPPLIPFFNSQPWGVERLGPSAAILIMPFLLFTIFAVNNVLSNIFYKQNSLIARILSFNSFLFILLGFLAYVQIVLLVF